MKSLTPAKVTMIMFMVVGGLVLAYIAKSLLAHEEKKPEVTFRNLPMPIADLPPGTVITADHLGLGPLPIADLKRDMLLQNKVIVGRVVKELLPAAQPIRSGQLYEPGARPPLKITKGMRAVTIDAHGATSIVDGLIKPGEHVDVHFTVTALQGDPRLRGGMTMTLFKGVKVLAINRMVMQGVIESDRNSVTLELTPEQANIIIIARDRGNLTLSYNPLGKGDGRIALADKDRATLEEILGLSPIKQPDPPPPPFVSQVYRGVARQLNQFDSKNQVIDQPLPPAPPPPPVSPPPPVTAPQTTGPQTTGPQTTGPQTAAPNNAAPNGAGTPAAPAPGAAPPAAAPPGAVNGNGPQSSAAPMTNARPSDGMPSA